MATTAEDKLRKKRKPGVPQAGVPAVAGSSA
jgi:hypothetical protein